MTISQIPTEELIADLEETRNDINMCEFAILMKVEYSEGLEGLKQRLETNKKIRNIIYEELQRRSLIAGEEN